MTPISARAEPALGDELPEVWVLGVIRPRVAKGRKSPEVPCGAVDGGASRLTDVQEPDFGVLPCPNC